VTNIREYIDTQAMARASEMDTPQSLAVNATHLRQNHHTSRIS
jgi:hypothetical protein